MLGKPTPPPQISSAMCSSTRRPGGLPGSPSTSGVWSFIDAGSIGILVAARRAALEHDCAFLLTNTRGQVRQVLTVAGALTALTRVEVPGQAGGAGAAHCV
jgi:hypothetical protein